MLTFGDSFSPRKRQGSRSLSKAIGGVLSGNPDEKNRVSGTNYPADFYPAEQDVRAGRIDIGNEEEIEVNEPNQLDQAHIASTLEQEEYSVTSKSVYAKQQLGVIQAAGAATEQQAGTSFISQNLLVMSPKHFKKPIQFLDDLETTKSVTASIQPELSSNTAQSKNSSSHAAGNSIWPTLVKSQQQNLVNANIVSSQQSSDFFLTQNSFDGYLELFLPLILAFQAVVSSFFSSNVTLASTTTSLVMNSFSLRQIIAFCSLLFIFVGYLVVHLRFASSCFQKSRFIYLHRIMRVLIMVSYLECSVINSISFDQDIEEGKGKESSGNESNLLREKSRSIDINSIFIGCCICLQLFPPMLPSNDRHHPVSRILIAISLIAYINLAWGVTDSSVISAIFALCAVIFFSLIRLFLEYESNRKRMRLLFHFSDKQTNAKAVGGRAAESAAAAGQLSDSLMFSPRFGGGGSDGEDTTNNNNNRNVNGGEAGLGLPPQFSSPRSRRNRGEGSTNNFYEDEENFDSRREFGMNQKINVKQQQQQQFEMMQQQLSSARGMSAMTSGRAFAEHAGIDASGGSSSRRECFQRMQYATVNATAAAAAAAVDQEEEKRQDDEEGEIGEDYSDNNFDSMHEVDEKQSNNVSLFAGQTRSDMTTVQETDTSTINIMKKQKKQLQRPERITRQQSQQQSQKGKGNNNNSNNAGGNMLAEFEELQFRVAMQDMILGNFSEGIVVVSKDTDQVVYANRQACSLLRCSVEDVMPSLLALRNLLNFKDEVLNFSEILSQFEVPEELSKLSTMRGLYLNLQWTKEQMMCVVQNNMLDRVNKKVSSSAKKTDSTNSNNVASIKTFLDSSNFITVEADQVRGSVLLSSAAASANQAGINNNPFYDNQRRQQNNNSNMGISAAGNKSYGIQSGQDDRLQRYVVFTIKESPKWSNPIAVIHSTTLKIQYFIRKMISELSIDMNDIRDYFINLKEAFAQVNVVPTAVNPVVVVAAETVKGGEESISTAKEGSEEQRSGVDVTEKGASEQLQQELVAPKKQQQQSREPKIDINGCVGKIDCMTEFLQDFATSSLLISGTFIVIRKEFNLQQLILAVVDKIRKRTTSSQYVFNVNYESHVPTLIVSDFKRLDRVFYNLLLYFIDTCEAATLRIKVVQQISGGKKMLKVSVSCEKKLQQVKQTIAVDSAIADNQSSSAEDGMSSGLSGVVKQYGGVNANVKMPADASGQNKNSQMQKTMQISLSQKKAIITNVQMLENMHYGVLLSSSIISKLEPNDLGIIFESGPIIAFTFKLSL